MKKKVLPRAAFVTTVAVVVLEACGGQVTLEGGPGDKVSVSNPPSLPPDVPLPEGCPSSVPEDGAPCNPATSYCYYGDEPCEGSGEGHDAYCDADTARWDVTPSWTSCNPPPPDCPADMPNQGAPCDSEVNWETCYYYDYDCGIDVWAECLGDAWQVPGIDCNPPPPETCYLMDTEQDCGGIPGCSWLVPGCGDLPLEIASCHPTGQCDSDLDCPDELLCVNVVIDPCYQLPCDACGEERKLCVQSVGDSTDGTVP